MDGWPGEAGDSCRSGLLGHTPNTAGTFRKKFRKNSGKTPETLSERFLEFPSRVRLGCPKPYNLRHLRLPEHFQIPEFSPPQYGWGRLFFQNWFRRGPLRACHGIPSSTGGISDLLRTDKVVPTSKPKSRHGLVVICCHCVCLLW